LTLNFFYQIATGFGALIFLLGILRMPAALEEGSDNFERVLIILLMSAMLIVLSIGGTGWLIS